MQDDSSFTDRRRRPRTIASEASSLSANSGQPLNGENVMKKTLWVIIVFLALSFLCVRMSLAQGPTPTPAVSVGTPTPDIEKRLSIVEGKISVLEHKQESVLRATEIRIEQLQTLLSWLGIVFVVLSVIFGGMAAVATWRQTGQQERIIKAQVESAGKVSDVLDVTHRILDSRLLQIPEKEEIRKLRADFARVTDFIDGIRKGISYQRELLERAASELSQTARHDFKKRANIEALNTFARDFDRFKMLYPEEAELNGQCLYIRGVAAVFNNEFQDLQNWLNKVIGLERQDGEDPTSYRKRLANAYYYLGLNHANLGELKDAIRRLEQAHDLDPEGTDFLTRLVMAEAYVTYGQYEKAEDLLQEIERGLNDLKRRQGNRLLNHQLRMLSRTYLMRANMAIIAGMEDWQERARQYAEEACEIDPGYYYAPFTLGQIIRAIEGGTDTEQVKKLFSDAYSRIQDSGHLHFVTETRIHILLLMVSALCGRHGEKADERTVNTYLDEARLLRDDLPRIDNRVCTVFSPLSKQNVDRETIGSHIEKIREGTWSLHPE